MDDAAALAAALEFERGYYARAAPSAAPHPLGLLVRDDAVPRAHVQNMLWVTATAVTPEELLTALEETHAGLAHRKAQVDDDALGAALAGPLRAAGYRAERHLYMALRRPRDREATARALEVDEATHAAVEAAVTREFPDIAEEEVVQQLLRARAALNAAAPEGTRFWVGVDGGAHAGNALLRRGPGVAQVEDVATLTAHRGRGLARAAVGAAVDAAAGAELVFLVADDEDWPKELYAKLGFDPIGAVWAFVKDPA